MSAAKMLTLWALAITLAVQAEALLSLWEKLPIKTPRLLPVLSHGSPLIPKGSSSVVENFMSISEFNDYLNATLVPQIEKMLMSEDVDLASVFETVLETFSDTNLLSLLDFKNSLESLVNGGLRDIQDKLKQSNRVIKRAVPSGMQNEITDILRNINMKDLTGLEFKKVTVDNVKFTKTDDDDDKVTAKAEATAILGLKGLEGPLADIIEFQVTADVNLDIDISQDDNQCISFHVKDKDIKTKEVYLQLLVTNILPLSVPLPLDDIISQLLTDGIKENMKDALLSDLDLSDYKECKNCEYKHPTSLGLPWSMQTVAKPP